MPGSKNIAVIGLGSMGLGMAQSLLRTGHVVIGCDISTEALDRLKASGGRAVRTPAEAAGNAEIIVVVVVNATQTETTLFGVGGDIMSDHPATASARFCDADRGVWTSLSGRPD